MLKKINRIRVFEQAVEQLRSAIIEGQYRLGDQLPTEQELCAVLEVSRSSVREALRVLEAEGIIESRRGSGTYVSQQLSKLATRGEILKWLAQREESVIQILEVREGIEWLTASLVATTPDDTVIRNLNTIIEQQWAGIKSAGRDPDVIELADLDVQFHLAISAASGNEIAHEIIAHIVPAFSAANRAVLWAGGNVEVSIREHEDIATAIEEASSSAAEKAMRQHIKRVRQEICNYLGEQRGPDG